jgi:hypothetical protein
VSCHLRAKRSRCAMVWQWRGKDGTVLKCSAAISKVQGLLSRDQMCGIDVEDDDA